MDEIDNICIKPIRFKKIKNIFGRKIKALFALDLESSCPFTMLQSLVILQFFLLYNQLATEMKTYKLLLRTFDFLAT